jgi:hypothetical protein
MSNTILTPDVIAKEALMVLENNLVMAGLVHRDYSKEFVSVGDTITVRRPAKFIAKNFTGTVSAQDITESSVVVKMDRFRDITVNISSKEMSLDLKDFSEQIVVPAMQAIAQAVDQDIMAVGLEGASKTIASSASPTDLSDLAAIGKYFDSKAVPIYDRRLVLNPDHKYKYAALDNLSNVSYAGSSETLRNSEIGKIYTMDTFMSQNAPSFDSATAGTATAFKVTGTAGASTVALSSVTAASGTVKTGDAFIVDGYMYRFAEDKTASSGSVASVAIDQPLHADLSAKDAVLIKAPNSLAFHKNGIALVTRQLELPQGASKAAITSANGLSVRVVFGYDQATKTDKISFDVIYGIKILDQNMVAKLVG